MNLQERSARTWFSEGFEEAQINALLVVAQEEGYHAGEEVVAEGKGRREFKGWVPFEAIRW